MPHPNPEPEDLKVIHGGSKAVADLESLAGNRDPRVVSLFYTALVAAEHGTNGPPVSEAEWATLTAALPTRFLYHDPGIPTPYVMQLCRLPLRNPNDDPNTPTTHWRIKVVREAELRMWRALVYDQPVLVSGAPFDPAIFVGGIRTVIEKALAAEGASRAEMIYALLSNAAAIFVAHLPVESGAPLMLAMEKELRDVVLKYTEKLKAGDLPSSTVQIWGQEDTGPIKPC